MGRRQWGRMEEMKAKNEREAAWRAATTGKEVVRAVLVGLKPETERESDNILILSANLK